MTDGGALESGTLLAARQGRLARLTLNRPGVLNALDRPTCRRIAACLAAWRDDPAVGTVLIDSASPRAFCAGGDLRAIRAILVGDGPDAAAAFFRACYRLVALLAAYPKPVVSFMDGITMGGGVGLGGHVHHRVVTERTMLAMPETAIGLTPDAGGSYILSRAPGLSGLRLALTGRRMGGEEAVAMGFADRVLPAGCLPELARELARRPAGEGVAMFASPGSSAGPAGAAGGAEGDPAAVDRLYDAPDVATIRRRLAGSAAPWAAADLAALERASPLALEVTFRAYFAARRLPDLNSVLEQEYRLVANLVRQPDFAEGVRARILDKDQAPGWLDPDQVPRAAAACFAPRADGLDLSPARAGAD